jgi:hypothetical protein
VSDVTVWKFDLRDDAENAIEMPRGAQVLSVQVQRGQPRLWALVDPTAPKVRRRFWICGTGTYANTDGLGTFVDTIQLEGGALVFHVFDGGEIAAALHKRPDTEGT